MKDKYKNYSSCQRASQGMRNSVRYVAIFVVFVVVAFLVSSQLNSSALSPFAVSADRSEAYNVKVLPASLSDEELNQLPKDTFSYMAMIDAGSSGCRAHVYRYGKLGTLTGPLYVLPQHDSLKVKPGLSSFASHPTDAGASLQGLVDFLKEQVPEADWAVTPIWLKATAGLRMLEKAQSDAVLTSVRAFLLNKSSSPFLFRPSYASIISGNEEGGFGWIAFNYLKRIIGPKKSGDAEPYAVVEMGGASSQVSQRAPSAAAASLIPEQYRFSFSIEGESYDLYTHSYLGFGAEQGRAQLNKMLSLSSATAASSTAVQDPCLNTGYTREASAEPKEVYEGPEKMGVAGSSSQNPAMCAFTMGGIFGVVGADLSCPLAAPLPRSFGCTHQPAFVAASKNFLVFENFYYMASALAVPPTGGGNYSVVAASSSSASFPLITTASQIRQAAEMVCGLQWDSVQKSFPRDGQGKDVNLKLCFSSAYAYSFLVDGLKLPKDKQLTIQKEVGPSEIEWALGAAYKEAAELLKRTNLRPT